MLTVRSYTGAILGTLPSVDRGYVSVRMGKSEGASNLESGQVCALC